MKKNKFLYKLSVLVVSVVLAIGALAGCGGNKINNGLGDDGNPSQGNNAVAENPISDALERSQTHCTR